MHKVIQAETKEVDIRWVEITEDSGRGNKKLEEDTGCLDICSGRSKKKNSRTWCNYRLLVPTDSLAKS